MSEVSHQINHRQMVKQSDNIKFAFWFFLGGEIVLFSTLILTYAVFRITHVAEYASFRSELNVPLVSLNTFVLIISSYLVVRSLQAIRQSQVRAALFNLLGVLGFGALFIGGQAYEWSELFAHGVNINSTFGSPFYIITGIHGTHVLVGLAWAAFLIIQYAFQPSHDDQPIEIFGLYWHFVDIVWIILFSLIYLL